MTCGAKTEGRSGFGTAASKQWVALRAAALALWSFAILLPQTAHAECPPAVDPGSGLEQTMGQCGNWVCDVTYDPSTQILPNDPALDLPWQVDMTWGATQVINNDRLVVTLPDPAIVPDPDPTPDIGGVNILRYEPILAAGTVPVYAIQVRVTVEGRDRINMPDKRLFVIGTGDNEKISTVSLGYYRGERIIALGEAGPAWDDPEFDPQYTLPWDFEQFDTTYTLVVEMGVAAHLLVDEQPLLSRPWNTLPYLGEMFDGIFVVAHEGSLTSSTTSFIHYCVCEPVSDGTQPGNPSPGCSCTTTGGSSPSPAIIIIVAFLLFWIRRRA